jgi:hypothetical protein
MKFTPFEIEYKGGAVKITEDQAKAMGLNRAVPEMRGTVKHFGPWQIIYSYRALAVSHNFATDKGTVFGWRQLNKPREDGHCLRGSVSIKGKWHRAFTASQLFELPDGFLFNVATIHVCKD